jgi:hypothetical protein
MNSCEDGVLFIGSKDLLIKIHIPHFFQKYYAMQTSSYEIHIPAAHGSAFQKN